ncbi:MAG: hypothetical protein H6731_02375 [Myxococcales bacterium]|nr:MAG: hypothetical protein H6731_02375 [Myxococcales bacterium]
MPAYYYQNNSLVVEPEEAGLYVMPTSQASYEKIYAHDKSVCLFQVGQFGQLASNDKIKATKHFVKKSYENVERFTFALFFEPDKKTKITSHSVLALDSRYQDKQLDGAITYQDWSCASFELYRAP